MATHRDDLLLEGEFLLLSKKKGVHHVTLTRSCIFFHLNSNNSTTYEEKCMHITDIVGCHCLEQSGSDKSNESSPSGHVDVDDHLTGSTDFKNGEVTKSPSRSFPRATDASASGFVIFAYPFRKKLFSSKKVRTREVLAFEVLSSTKTVDERRKVAETWRNVINCLCRDLPVSFNDIPHCVPPPKGKLLLLINPFSGPGKAYTIFKNEIAPMLNEACVPYKALITEHAGHAGELMKTIDLSDWYGVVIVSGDGLVFETINGIMQRDNWATSILFPIGCLPAGSGNALCCSINYAAGEPVDTSLVLHSTFVLVKHRVVPMDLVVVHIPDRTIFSFLSVTWGIVADIDFESEKYRKLGEARFTVGAIKRIIESSASELEDTDVTFDRRRMLWRHREASDVSSEAPPFSGDSAHVSVTSEPIEYFRRFIDDDTIAHMVTESNKYSIQKNIMKPLRLSQPELEQFFGIAFMMSIVRMPSCKLYWDSTTRYGLVADTMTNKRFKEIKSNIHCNDNNKQQDNEGDKLFKLRPLVDALKVKFNSIKPAERLSIDEQVIPFKGQSSLRQYNPKKPKKWGYKVFVCSSISGLIHDFEIYTGKIDVCPGQPDLGASANIVLRLLQRIPKNVWHKVYFDNWFNSPALQACLWKQGIACLGTVRANRLKGCNLCSDKELKTKGRGSSVVCTAATNGATLKAIKWYDNKAVTLLSTYAAVEPECVVRRWDRKAKKEIHISCPAAVKEYNMFMGGVDLLDSLLALYRIPIRSKKWYHRILFHFLDVSVVQAWLTYCSDVCKDGMEKKDRLPLVDFKLQIALCLLKAGKSENNKRGRPSGSTETQLVAKKKRGQTANVPPFHVRTDNVGHSPNSVTNKGRCKLPGCKGYSRTVCEKCNLHLCLNKHSNCFKVFHET